MNEIISRRRISSKTFDLGNGKVRLSTRRSPYHYLKNGVLEDIDLVSRVDGDDHLIDKAPMTLRIHPSIPMYRYSSQAGEVSVELTKVGTRAPKISTAILEGTAYRWEGVIKGTDYLISPLPFGVKTELILNSDRTPKTWEWEILGTKNLIGEVQGIDASGQLCEIVTELNGDTLTATWTGRVTSQRRLRRKPNDAYHTNVVYPVLIDPTVNEAVSANADDLYSTTGSGIYDSVANMYVGFSGTSNYKMLAGARFQTIPIPQGASIVSATMTVDVTVKSGSTITVNIFGDDLDDAPAWGAGSRIQNITKTTATATFSKASTGTSAVDVQSIVAEIIARAGWSSDNDMRFALTNTSGAQGDNIQIACLEHATRSEVQLDIVYSTGGFAYSQVGIIG